MEQRKKLAIICSHPIQYYAPWFQYLAENTDLCLKVFYLWKREDHYDPGFDATVKWDVPLLDGYDFTFVTNVAADPGTHHWGGLDNPSLRKELIDFEPDVVLTYGYKYKSINEFLALWGRRSPILFRGDSHRLYSTDSLYDHAKRLVVSIVFRRYAACLYVGKANKEYFRLYGVPEEKLFFCPHSVDNARFISSWKCSAATSSQLKCDLGIPAEHKVILFSGKFESKKRPLDLLNAFRSLSLKGLSLLFVGSGELEGELRAEAGSLEHVFFLPFQNQSKMPGVYSAADLVVLPSFGSYETWGLSINEAMCMKRPCVVSSHVGCAPDLVIPGETGWIFEAGNTDELVRVLEEAFAQPAKLKEMGEKAYQVIQNYSYQQSTEGLCLALNAVLGEK